MIATIHPIDETHWLSLRKHDVTSTEVAALFGLSPYMTHFELWHRKHDNMEIAFEPSERMKWGMRLQDSIAAGIFEDQGWLGRKKTEYMCDTDLRMGASFDFEYEESKVKPEFADVALPTPEQMVPPGILEIKNVDSLAFRDGWIVDGENVEAPPHIELQIQQQLSLTGYKCAYIGALIGGNRVVLIKRVPDHKVIEAIKGKIKAFWESVDSHSEPRPDYIRDYDIISRIYGYAEPGKIFNANEAVSKLAFAYKQASAEAKAASDKKDAAKAEILTLVGNAEKVLGETFTISAGLIGPTLVPAYERKGYRQFKLTFKKEKP